MAKKAKESEKSAAEKLDDIQQNMKVVICRQCVPGDS